LQRFDTEKGAVYTVTFSIAANPERWGQYIVEAEVVDCYKGKFVTKKSPYNTARRPRPTDWTDVSFAFKVLRFIVCATAFHSQHTPASHCAFSTHTHSENTRD
jgi:hypothetical protein